MGRRMFFRRSTKRASLLITAIVCAGCGGGGQSTNKPEGAPAAQQATWRPTGNEGTLVGKVNFQGQPPKLKPLSMEADPVCAKKHSDPVYPETVVANRNNTLRNILVRVKTGLEGKTFSVPDEPVTLDQEGCMYKPHVLGIQAGQKLKIVSSDATAHNIHPLPRENREWNVSQAPGADPILQSFNKPEVSIPVKCNQHAWMRAYVHVLSHPFYAVTGGDGEFRIKGLPPGKYEIEALHEQYGAMTETVEVPANQTATVTFTYKAAQAYRPGSLTTAPALVLGCCGRQ
jgi:plastocyanin